MIRFLLHNGSRLWQMLPWSRLDRSAVKEAAVVAERTSVERKKSEHASYDAFWRCPGVFELGMRPGSPGGTAVLTGAPKGPVI